MLLFSGETNEKNVSLGSCDVRLHRGISQRIYLVQKKIYMTVFFLLFFTAGYIRYNCVCDECF